MKNASGSLMPMSIVCGSRIVIPERCFAFPEMTSSAPRMSRRIQLLGDCDSGDSSRTKLS